MSIGTGIALFVVGAVLAFAVNIQLDWIDLSIIGYLLMGAGVVVFVIGIVLMVRKRETVTTVHNGADGSSQRRTSSTPDEY